jgi:hypothetical protein
MHRRRDVLQRSKSQVANLERKLSPNLLVDLRGNADAPGRRNAFEPRRDVDAVAVDPALVENHVTDVDPDAIEHAPGLRHIPISSGHEGLDLEGALERVHDAWKFGQDPVAGGIDDATAKLPDERAGRQPGEP